eukprot:CAMPEP_0114433898 /NCGR_PEP_ID=MMETSP0103-20121206/11950_1 /TAXON_ID=37642 ORGANISM="Paraphysomonas imperforata, Strain PA2" /NCGR_SAMPLE_ID=MMETSP0103 /ASSEMBLY_ACC=CAM_ASM_000201 /LENGTH=814 /DNA_ID=CAMNT_0001603703 /DNA_START=52 /DNA_END=2496 /DNA_ORIENTATION=-
MADNHEVIVVNEADEIKKAKREQRKLKNRERGVYVVPIQEYADDHELYFSRYDQRSRNEYWEHLNNNPRKHVKKEEQSWIDVSQRNNFQIEIQNYSPFARRVLAFTATSYWDYLYIYLLGLTLVFAVMFYDDWLQDYIRIPWGLLAVPPFFMFLVQLIPTIAAVFVSSRYNDLVKVVARETFGHWAFNMVIICQYIEFTYYGGHRREHMAGKCRIDEEAERAKMEHYMDADGRIHTRRKRSKFYMMMAKIFPFLINQDEKIVHMSDIVEDDDFDEELEDSTYLSSIQNQNQGDDDSLIHDNQSVPLDNTFPGSSVLSGGESTAYGTLDSATVMEGMEGGHLKRMAEEKAKAEEEEKRKHAEIIKKREALIKKWTEWVCLCCGKKNRRPTHPPDEFLIAYSEKGLYYKRTIASLKIQKKKPRCTHCYAHEDFVPRLCTGHYFKYNPYPHKAFENYPEVVPSMKRGFFKGLWDKGVSCLFGQRNHPDSRLMVNDWRLSIYLSSRFPIMPRAVKGKDELYEMGEIIECRRQKSDWCRGRIIEARQNHIYDIKYDTGDDVRVVEEHELRLPPGKGAMAYRTELGIAMLVLFFPLGLMGAIMMGPGLLFFPTLLFSISLLLYRIHSFFETFFEYYSAGCCVIFQQSMIFTTPILMLFITSLFGLMKESLGVSWIVIAVLVIVTELTAMPVIYIKRPTFAVMVGILFFETSLTFLFLALKLDGVFLIPYMLVDLFPGFVAIYTLLRFRRWLGYVWDVSMRIRPLEFDFYEPSYLGQLLKKSGLFSKKVSPTEEDESDEDESEEEEDEGDDEEQNDEEKAS